MRADLARRAPDIVILQHAVSTATVYEAAAAHDVEPGQIAKTLSNIEEVKARHRTIIAVGTAGDDSLASIADMFLPIPDVPEVVQPLVAVIPLQLLAYHTARLRGCDIDKPRNLAKSVTVE